MANKLFLTSIICISSWVLIAQAPAQKAELVRIKHPDGRESVYITVDSIQQGLCVDYDPSGRREVECSYIDGKLTGPYIFYYSDGAIASETYYVDNVPHGKAVDYYHDGTIQKIEHYNMGLRDGIQELYIEDGRLDKRLLFRNDTLIRILVDNHYLPWAPVDKKKETD